MKIRILYYLLLVSIFYTSCKSDNTDQEFSEKDIYFQDYESSPIKWGYIDTTGTIIIEKKYDDLRPFENGLAIANYEGQWGFIDKNGNAVIPHTFRSAFPFKENLARIQNFDKKYGFINSSGKITILDTFDLVFDFNSGRARAQKNTNYGYINQAGKWVIEPLFKKCSNFENGYAKVYQFGLAGLIDTSGTFIIPLDMECEKIYDFSDDMLRVKKQKKQYFFERGSFDQLSEPYDNATDFHNGVAAVQKDGNWYFMDKSFKKIRDIAAEEVKYAGESKWIVKKGTKQGLIDQEGNSLTLIEYDMIFNFHNGLAPFQKNELWGYLDAEGSEAMKASMPLAWEFEEGYARVIDNGIYKHGYAARFSERLC